MSVSKFTIKDYNLIKKEWGILFLLAQQRCRSEEELAVVKKAFDFANTAHRNVRRRSGEPYIIHPLQVAEIVVKEIGLGYKSISAALLHDVVEDTDYTIDDIRNLFGDRIALLVDGLTKIKTVLDNEDRKRGPMTSSESIQAENLKRILLTLNDDVRVVLIKLADRLHNCRTIEFMPEHKRDKILSETMFIFIPLAHRLGLYGVKSEMENIWLRFKEPEAYKEISDRVNRNVTARAKEINDFVAPIESALKQADIAFSIKKRIKTPYSVWFKMRTKNVPFEQIYDLYAVRIIFDPTSPDAEVERRQAYLIYSILIGLYTSQQSRFRDWISTPKSNGYEALHCTLMSQAGIWIEVQIRSRRMDDIAEKGIAAHWAYKNDGYLSEVDSEMDRWLKKVQEILVSEDVNAIELLDIIHKDLVATDIVVFTPKGEQRSVQYGATVLDFAYNIHTHIGNQAIAAKVNMKLTPLSQTLKAGDQVEIITAESGKPKIEWLQFLQTRHARNQVIEYFKRDRRKLVERGKAVYAERLSAMGVENSKSNVKLFLRYNMLNDASEMFFRIGLGLIGPEAFRSAFGSGHGEAPRLQGYSIATCCNPIPGDPVIGFRNDDGTVLIHKKSCPELEKLAMKFGSSRFVVVDDFEGGLSEFPVRLSIRGIDTKGLLNKITQYISLTMGINIREIHLGGKDGVMEGYIEMLVHDRQVLSAMLKGIAGIDGIQDVVRTDI
ncbi:MAG: bifunctional (p)ppGpp synthetase/guanosine-3',5'-bis(diphosphate) 3'-pyrophosphohydrolase [Bacteroidales bacterium]|nr:bifunctional (p)ppGpp synthetase/guanosine-3',5'-bis(diphosphate) 3'-pyrophosphohydrolase [Bacteroidales bacterium]